MLALNVVFAVVIGTIVLAILGVLIDRTARHGEKRDIEP